MADCSQNTVFHNAARNGRLWAVAFFLSFESSKDPLRASDAGGNTAAATGRGGGEARDDGYGRHTDSGDVMLAVGSTGGGTVDGSGNTNAAGGGAQAGNSRRRDRSGGAAGGGETRAVLRNGRTATRAASSALRRRTDCDGHTALDWACYSGHAGVARLLVEHGLNPFSTDAGGKTCLHWAASQVG